MATCPSCKRRFDGLAAHCPHCGHELPRAGLLTAPTPPAHPRKNIRPRIWGIVVGPLVGVLVFIAGFYLNLVQNLCFDFTGGDGNECLDEERRLVFWFWVGVIPCAVIAGIASGMALTRVLRKREARRRPV